MPSPPRVWAASRAKWTSRLQVMTVRSLPARFTSAAPRGMVYSPSGISSLWAYSSLCSRNTTGSSSRIADFSRPWRRQRCRGHHLQSREVAEEILQALGMLACVPAAGAHRRPQDHGDAALSAGHVADLGSLVEQGIRALRGEVIVHQLHHGPQPRIAAPRPCPQTPPRRWECQ